MPKMVSFETLPPLEEHKKSSVEATMQAVRRLVESLRKDRQTSNLHARVEMPRAERVAESPSDFWD